MRALVLNEFGPANQAFTQTNVLIPEVHDNQMLIRVQASSVNPVDCKIRSGLYQNIAPDAPTILHGDVSGTVEEIGKSVSRFSVGDDVYGCAGGFKDSQGALAEYMLVDADLMALKPKSLSFIQSASLPLVAITAWLALIERVNIQPGQRVLIHGASGGVGALALQLAIFKGARTFTTTSEEKKGVFATKAGATVINYKTTSVDEYVQIHTQGVGFDIIFDTVGGENLATSIHALKPTGTICSVAASSSVDLVPLYKKAGTLHYIFMPAPLLNKNSITDRQAYGKILNQIAMLVDNNAIKPLIGKTINFSSISEAHEMQEHNSMIGKIALKQDLNPIGI